MTDMRRTAGLKLRGAAVAAMLLLGFAGVGMRLVYLQVIKHDEYNAQAERQQSKLVKLPARRGRIYDRYGRELAVSVETKSLYAVPCKVKDVNSAARTVAPLIGARVKDVAKRLRGKGSFVWLARKVSPDVPEKLERAEGAKEYTGWLEDSRRYYPKRGLASHVLGFTGMDNEGLEGLESSLDEYIAGRPGRAVMERDGTGREVLLKEEGYVPPVAGADVTLTIDETVQHIVEKELDGLMKKYSPASASAIVMDPISGEILALANRPAFNPNSFLEYPEGSWRNIAVSDIYEPGSTFKVVTAAAALEEGTVTPAERFYCGDGSIKVGGKVIRDAHREKGYLTFAEIIQKSINTGTVKVALKLGDDKLYDYARRFGFGEKTGVDLPGEAKGVLRERKLWSGVSVASVAIGQEVGVTPLQMLSAMNCIANRGRRVRPYVVSTVTGPDGEVIEQSPDTEHERVVSEATAGKLTEILCTVVEEGGTAVKANISGYNVAGKTGTAQKFDRKIGRYSREKYVSSFVGFVPAEEPRISVIVVVNEPHGAIYGGTVAAPAFRSIVEQTMTYLKVPTRLPEQILLVERGE